ncbi:MAG TPA: helix-turn-helix domain-containing protein [Pyrinomonadaceae bacterium]|jgi:excisionase family DNA binding protein
MKDVTPQTDGTRDEFLTARQLAAILQVSEATVRRLARKGRIPSIRLTPRIMRFHLPSVREALDGGRARTRRTEAEAEEETTQLSFTDLF